MGLASFVRAAATAALLTEVGAAQAQPAGRRSMPAADREVIMRAVGDHLRDSVSARYRWPQASTDPDEVGYCGFVNAKNAFGAYVGFVPFFIIGGRSNGPRGDGRYFVTDVRLAVEDGADPASQLVRRMCMSIGYDPSILPPEGH